ncbi:lysine--tRNA ligase [Patescibacteria group bacterium AH-259-L05]|nr:lysine--tRNA ligase [Patescibacteria group bacterium AH-259-L05]
MGEEKDRIKKLEYIKKQGIDPYPARSNPTHTCDKARVNFSQLSRKRSITLVGRLVLIRLHGKSCFAHLEDASGRFQVYFKEDILGSDRYEFFVNYLDIGDFIQVTGKLFKTKKGEKTLQVDAWQVLSKALLPLPEKWHGLTNVEKRFRERYLDLLSNKEVKKIFITRSNVITWMREFFDKRDFIEVETPILQSIPGGAAARPFVTHHHALDIDLYLRIAPELYLKRLLVGGFEKVYEISRCFRNEGIDWAHNPEFTQIEFYAAYMDYNDFMALTEELFEFLGLQLLKKRKGAKLEFEYQKEKINFKPPYKRIEFRQALIKFANIDIEKHPGVKSLADEARRKNLTIDKKWSRMKVIDEIFKELVVKSIINPTFIINHPVELSPLSKRMPDDPRYVERFQLIAGGIEVCNGFTELNDPLDQVERFRQQKKLRKAGDVEAQPWDEEYLIALKHGMPPAAGEGIGIDRLIGLFTNTHNIKEVILFPTMRPK